MSGRFRGNVRLKSYEQVVGAELSTFCERLSVHSNVCDSASVLVLLVDHLKAIHEPEMSPLEERFGVEESAAVPTRDSRHLSTPS